MLVPALLRKDEIERKSKELCYSEQSFYYGDGLGQNYINVDDRDDYMELFQYAIVDTNNDVIGYFRYRIDWYNSCASSFGLIGFSIKPNGIIGIDIRRELEKIIHKYKIHRVEFKMIKGNPVEKHYEKFTRRYNGRILVFKDVIKDREGKYHDSVTYEIINEIRKER